MKLFDCNFLFSKLLLPPVATGRRCCATNARFCLRLCQEMEEVFQVKGFFFLLFSEAVEKNEITPRVKTGEKKGPYLFTFCEFSERLGP